MFVAVTFREIKCDIVKNRKRYGKETKGRRNKREKHLGREFKALNSADQEIWVLISSKFFSYFLFSQKWNWMLVENEFTWIYEICDLENECRKC